MREQESQSLRQLEDRQSRLSKVLAQRQQLYDAVGTGRVKPTGWEAEIKVGRTKSKVAASIERIQNTSTQITEKIADLKQRQNEDLVTQAQAYCDEVALRKEQLREIKGYVREGHLSQEILERREGELRALKAKPGEDLDLQRGIELLKRQKQEVPTKTDEEVVVEEETEEEPTQKKPKEEEKLLPNMVINLETRGIEIDGRKVRRVRSQIQWDVLVLLARKAQKEVAYTDVVKTAQKAGSKVEIPSGAVISHLRERLEVNPKDPQLITQFGSAKRSRYCLNAQVEFVGEDPKVRKRREAQQVYEVQLPDGQTANIRGKIKARTLERLLLTSKEDQVTLNELLKASGSTRAGIGVAIKVLRKDLRPLSWLIIQSVAHVGGWGGVKGEYYLEKISTDEEEPREVPPAPWPTRMEALELLLEDPSVTTQEIIKRLGKSKPKKGKKEGRYLTWIQAYFALRKAINLMSIRDTKGTATEEELGLLKKIDQFRRAHKLVDINEFKSWLKLKLAPTQKEAEEVVEISPPSPFTLKEAAILAAEINTRSDIIQRYQIQPVPEVTANELRLEITEALKMTEEELFHQRHEALAKMINIVKNDLIDEVYDQQTSEAVKCFLIYFLTLDPPKTYDLLRELLEISLVRFHRDDGWGRVTKYWRELSHQPLTKEGEEKVSISETQPTTFSQGASTLEEVASHPLVVEPVREGVSGAEEVGVEPAQKAVEEPTALEPPAQVPTEKPPVVERPKSLIERNDPKIRQKIVDVLEKLKEERVTKPISAAQLTRIFPRVKMVSIRQVAEQGYISPRRGRNNHPIYTAKEIAILVYLKDRGNGLSRREKRELSRIIDEEIEKRRTKKTK